MEAEGAGVLGKFRRWVAIAIALSALLYIGYALYSDLPQTAAELRTFNWRMYAGVLLLTLVNYGLRYLKWHYLLGRLGVDIPHSKDIWIFGSGLAMVISPAKAGEIVKPYLIREVTGTPMERTIPALVAERVTDGIAVVALATFGVTTFAPDRLDVIVFAGAVLGSGFLVLLNQRVSMSIISFIGRLSILSGISSKLADAYQSMRICLAPVPLTITVAMSLAAWFAECLGMLLVYRGLGVNASIQVSTFVYAFATTAGGFSPGGLGVTDVVLGELGQSLLPGLTAGGAVAASLLIRIATLWFGVVLGALALLRVPSLLEPSR